LLSSASYVIYDRFDAALPSAVSATKEGPLGLDAMADNPASTVIAYRSQLVNGTFEAIERMSTTCGDDLKSEIVIVPADLTLSHWILQTQGSAACCASTRRARSAGRVPSKAPVGLT
jgi:hypothetical protein